jgi:hypothetical protein
MRRHPLPGAPGCPDADSRHRGLRLLLQEEVVRRRFAHWSMGLVHRDDMAAAMRSAHVLGCSSPEQARQLLDELTSRPPP